MADNVYSDDAETAYNAPVVVAPQPVTDVDRAERFLREHRERASAAESQFSDIMRQRQAAIAETRTALNQTIQELRARHSGAGPGQVNLPLLSLAAGMLQTTPGVVSNFGNELGRGLGAMGTTIANQRMRDVDFLKGIADLQQKMGALEDVPLKDAAILAREKQMKEEANVGSLEGKLISAKLDRPQGLPGGFIYDPKTKKVVFGATGQPVDFGGTPGDPNGPEHLKLVGSDVHGDDYLKSIADPSLRAAVKGFGDYEEQLPSMPRTPQAMAYMQNLFAMAKQYNPDFDQKEYKAIQTATQNWRGSGKMAVQALGASNTAKHLGNLQEAASDLDPSSFAIINKMRNVLSDQTDDPRVKRFQAALLPVVTEMTKFLGGGHPAEGTMQEWLKTVGAANGPRQLQGSFNEFAKIMHTQLENMANAKNADLRLKGDKRVSAETLIGGKEGEGESPADALAHMLRNDISTPGGLFAVKRRSINTERAMKKEPALPSFTAEQFDAAAKELKNPTDPQMKALSAKERDALFDQYFGPGAAAAARAKR